MVGAIANLHHAKIELNDNHPGLRCEITVADRGRA